MKIFDIIALMNHRIFIAINLPENIKETLLGYQEKWPEIPAKWTKKENLHITLVFIGNCSDSEIVDICQKTKEIALNAPSFDISLKKIIYGPPSKNPPKMIWAEAEKNQLLNSLQSKLENALLGIFKKECKEYHSHITLARIKMWDFKKMEPEETAKINENIELNFGAKSIEVMESQLKKSGPIYTILESCPLGN